MNGRQAGVATLAGEGPGLGVRSQAMGKAYRSCRPGLLTALPCPQATWYSPTALRPTAARLCPARWRWSMTVSLSRGRSEFLPFPPRPHRRPFPGSPQPGPAPPLTASRLVFRWFCHVDDDNYVNLRALSRLLASYPHTQDVYIGKPSLDRPIQATERISEHKVVSVSPWGCLPQPARAHPEELGRGPPPTTFTTGSLLTSHFTSPRDLSTFGLPPEELASASAEGWP